MDDMIKILADGTLDDMRKALSALDAAQLAALKAAEEAGKKRGGAFEMIDDALAALDTGSKQDEADAPPPPPPAPEDAPPPPPPAPEDAPPPPPASVDAGPIRLAVPTDRAALNARLAQALADGDTVAIVFADADGEALRVPPIEAKAHDFQHFGGEFPKLIYKPRIDLPITLPSVAVRQLFLLVEPEMGDDGPAAVAVCRLTGDLFAGGGRRAEIPDGNLLFSLS